MISSKFFNQSVSEFETKEGRFVFFGIASNLVKKGLEVEGILLILSTWNFATFRYAMKSFKVDQLRATINKLSSKFQKMKAENFATINFDKYRKEIGIIYTELSKIKGIEHTGAPKVMHLMRPKVFVMWDSYIRGEKTIEQYKQLEICKIGWVQKKYQKNAESYIQFLKDMQTTFKNIPLKNKKKTLAKAVDEFNYVNITLPIQLFEKRTKQVKNLKLNVDR